MSEESSAAIHQPIKWASIALALATISWFANDAGYAIAGGFLMFLCCLSAIEGFTHLVSGGGVLDQ